MTRSRRQKEKNTQLSSARQEIFELRSALSQAYRAFNASSDPDIVEASILEISALQARYGRMLRDLKNISEV